MNSTFAFVLIVVFSVLVSHLLQRMAPTWVRWSSFGYFAMGILLGPLVSGVLTETTLDSMQPLISLLIGLLGYDLGLSVRGHLRPASTVPARLMAWSFIALLVGGASYAFLYFASIFPGEAPWIAATLGIMAATSSTHVILEGVSRFRARGPCTDLLIGSSAIFVVAAAFSFGTIASSLRSGVAPLGGLHQLTTVEWLVATVLVGFGCGVLFIAFLGKERAPSHIFLAMVGSVTFASGMAAGLGISPLLVNLVAGGTVGGLSSRSEELKELVGRIHHPTYVLLLLLAGATWQWGELIYLAVFPVYLMSRLVGLRWGGRLAQAGNEGRVVQRLGEGLMAQGTLALTIAMNFVQLRPQTIPLVLTTLALATAVQDLVSFRLLRRVLADGEELDVDPQVASPVLDSGSMPATVAATGGHG